MPSTAARIEALLFTREQPLPRVVIADALMLDEAEVQAGLQALIERYGESAMEVVEVAGGWRLQLRSDYYDDLQALENREPPRYSRAFWETLAYIAYHQPCTRAEIDAVRGVSTGSGIYRQLFDLEWIRVVGHRELPGRPELLATTRDFLNDFALKALDELPPLPDETSPTVDDDMQQGTPL